MINKKTEAKMAKLDTVTDVEIQIYEKKQALIKDMFQTALKMQKEISFTNTASATDSDALGIMISQQLKWDGDKIFNTAYSAFEDANYHDFNKKFGVLWSKEVNKI
tara:strand:+ start:644 stop:961 length:318 start_codon:yes stop_codon:yes gene_type:complete